MKKLPLLLLLFFVTLSGCMHNLCTSDTYETSGLSICDNYLDIDPNEIDAAVDVLEIELRKRYINIQNIKTSFREYGVKVVFTEENLAVGCKKADRAGLYACENIAGGATIGGTEIYVDYYSCLGFTSFSHELLHAIEWSYLNLRDESDHNTAYFFQQGTDPYTDSIEYIVDDILQRELNSCQL